MSGWRLTSSATDDVAAIFVQSFEMFGLVQADAYHAGMEEVFDFLARFPRAARERTEMSPPVRAHPYRSHIIVYEIDEDDCVAILRVRHGRENWTVGQD